MYRSLALKKLCVLGCLVATLAAHAQQFAPNPPFNQMQMASYSSTTLGLPTVDWNRVRLCHRHADGKFLYMSLSEDNWINSQRKWEIIRFDDNMKVVGKVIMDTKNFEGTILAKPQLLNWGKKTFIHLSTYWKGQHAHFVSELTSEHSLTTPKKIFEFEIAEYSESRYLQDVDPHMDLHISGDTLLLLGHDQKDLKKDRWEITAKFKMLNGQLETLREGKATIQLSSPISFGSIFFDKNLNVYFWSSKPVNAIKAKRTKTELEFTKKMEEVSLDCLYRLSDGELKRLDWQVKRNLISFYATEAVPNEEITWFGIYSASPIFDAKRNNYYFVDNNPRLSYGNGFYRLRVNLKTEQIIEETYTPLADTLLAFHTPAEDGILTGAIKVVRTATGYTLATSSNFIKEVNGINNSYNYTVDYNTTIWGANFDEQGSCRNSFMIPRGVQDIEDLATRFVMFPYQGAAAVLFNDHPENTQKVIQNVNKLKFGRVELVSPQIVTRLSLIGNDGKIQDGPFLTPDSKKYYLQPTTFSQSTSQSILGILHKVRTKHEFSLVKMQW